eukprot:5197469-Pleurochrysis_carterae.AAC.2
MLLRRLLLDVSDTRPVDAAADETFSSAPLSALAPPTPRAHAALISALADILWRAATAANAVRARLTLTSTLILTETRTQT